MIKIETIVKTQEARCREAPGELNLGSYLDASPSPTPSCPVFSSPTTPNSHGSSELTENALLLDDIFLEFCLQNVSSNKVLSGPSNGIQEDVPDSLATMDNPMFDNFSDISLFLDPAMSLSLPFPLTSPPTSPPPTQEITYEFCDDALGLESPLTATSTSFSSPTPSLTSSPTPSLTSTEDIKDIPPASIPEANNRKRRVSSTVDDDLSPVSKESKQSERRRKNNVASQVSRAKRRNRTSNLFAREKELEVENARLKLQVEEMSQEAERLRKLLVNRLAQ